MCYLLCTSASRAKLINLNPQYGVLVKVFDKLAILRSMLWQMEVEVGLETLSQHQRDLYYAACLVADEDQVIHTDEVRNHPMLAPMSRPTFYRALKELVEKGFLAATGPRKDGRYLIKR